VDISLLESGYGWAIFVFRDDSKIVIHTTLNKELLGDIEHPSYSALYDIDKHRWIDLNLVVNSSLEVSDTCPHLGEVDEFVNKFV